MQDTFGLGMFWDANENIRLTLYFELNRNEKSENLAGHEKDIKDNAFTCRLQYKF